MISDRATLADLHTCEVQVVCLPVFISSITHTIVRIDIICVCGAIFYSSFIFITESNIQQSPHHCLAIRENPITGIFPLSQLVTYSPPLAQPITYSPPSIHPYMHTPSSQPYLLSPSPNPGHFKSITFTLSSFKLNYPMCNVSTEILLPHWIYSYTLIIIVTGCIRNPLTGAGMPTTLTKSSSFSPSISRKSLFIRIFVYS